MNTRRPAPSKRQPRHRHNWTRVRDGFGVYERCFGCGTNREVKR